MVDWRGWTIEALFASSLTAERVGARHDDSVGEWPSWGQLS